MHKLYEELDDHQVVRKLKEYERMSLDQLLKVDKKLITSDISKFEPSSLKKSLIFHLTFSKFVMKSGFIDYLTILADQISPDEYFYGLKLKSEKCDVQVIGSPQKITDPDLMSAQVEEYDLNFWD